MTSAAAVALGGCSTLPSSGPSRDAVAESSAALGGEGIQVVPITPAVTRELASTAKIQLFSEKFGGSPVAGSRAVASGDTIEVTIWEAPPATLFGGGVIEGRSASVATARSTTLPDQVVSSDGHIAVPFAGSIQAAGRQLPQIEQDIAVRLRGKANQPQVLVRLVRNTTSTVTVVGEVSQSVRMPLSPTNERLLDALAAAGGVRNPIGKTTLQVTRGGTVVAMPLDRVIRDPSQNVALQPGDVITAFFQPLSFTALGAAGKNEEINFETPGITLSQAVGRMGGVQDQRADPRGVFIFRYEDPGALTWPKQPVGTTQNGRVPVIYTIDLKDPASFFVMQSFGVQDKDLIYVANSSLAEFQKFANLVFSLVFPVVNTIQVTR